MNLYEDIVKELKETKEILKTLVAVEALQAYRKDTALTRDLVESKKKELFQ